MNYSKLILLQARTKLGDVKFGESIGMTDTGYRRMLNKQTCTVERLEKICKIYNVPMSYFFDDKPLSNVSAPFEPYGSCKDCDKKEGIIELLKEQLKEREGQISQLNRELGGRTPLQQANGV